ncbi:MAG: hypothetical protein H7A46_07165 [Verrucomicrobiales bacterium]|nr:hypothetical protein [Verrucomicrobiales bacterium]
MTDVRSETKKPSWLTPSAGALILANLVPLGGVLFFGWKVFPLMLIFWIENLIVGFFNALKMLTAMPQEAAAWKAKLFLVPFFCAHYGIFCLVHGMFVIALFGGPLQGGGFPSAGTVIDRMREEGLFWAVAALVVSHGFSFVTNYLGKGEYRRPGLDTLMVGPYGRIVVLHVALLLGGGVMMLLNSPALGLALLVAGKVVLDLKAHLWERRKLAAQPAVDAVADPS